MVLPCLTIPVEEEKLSRVRRRTQAEREDIMLSEMCQGSSDDNIATKIRDRVKQDGYSHWVMVGDDSYKFSGSSGANGYLVYGYNKCGYSGMIVGVKQSTQTCSETRVIKARLDITEEAEKISGWDYADLRHALERKGWKNIMVWADGYPTYAGWKQANCYVNVVANSFRVIIFL